MMNLNHEASGPASMPRVPPFPDEITCPPGTRCQWSLLRVIRFNLYHLFDGPMAASARLEAQNRSAMSENAVQYLRRMCFSPLVSAPGSTRGCKSPRFFFYGICAIRLRQKCTPISIRSFGECMWSEFTWDSVSRYSRYGPRLRNDDSVHSIRLRNMVSRLRQLGKCVPFVEASSVPKSWVAEHIPDHPSSQYVVLPTSACDAWR